MKSLNGEQKKWIMTSALLVVLGFNVSIHHFEKDAHGFAVINHQENSKYQREIAVSKEGTLELASSNDDRESDPTYPKALISKKKEKSDADVDKIIIQKNVAFANNKTGTVQYSKSEGKTVADITFDNCDCSPKKVLLNVDFSEDAYKMEHFLREKMLADSKKSADDKKEVAKKDDDSEVSKDDSDSEDQTPEQIAREKKRKLQLAREKKAFERILKECASNSELSDEIECRAEKMLDLAKDNSDSSITSKDKKIASTAFSDFYIKNIEKDMFKMIISTGSDDELNTNNSTQVGLKIKEHLIADLPKELDTIRRRILQVSNAIIVNNGAEYQNRTQQLNTWVTRQEALYKQNNQTYNKLGDQTYISMNQQAEQMKQANMYLSSQFYQNVRYGLSEAYKEKNLNRDQAINYLNAYGNSLIQVNNGMINPTDRRYTIQPSTVIENMDLGTSSMLQTNLIGNDIQFGQTSGLLALNSTLTAANGLLPNQQTQNTNQSLVTAPNSTLVSILPQNQSVNLIPAQPSQGSQVPQQLQNISNSSAGNFQAVQGAGQLPLNTSGRSNGGTPVQGRRADVNFLSH